MKELGFFELPFFGYFAWFFFFVWLPALVPLSPLKA